MPASLNLGLVVLGIERVLNLHGIFALIALAAKVDVPPNVPNGVNRSTSQIIGKCESRPARCQPCIDGAFVSTGLIS